METRFSGLPRRVDYRRIAVAWVFVLAALSAMPLIALYHALHPKPDLAPDFTLVDQNGAPFTLSSLRGHPVALVFGYTHCPDACPTVLANFVRAMHSASAPPGIRIVFVTVDPERDDPPYSSATFGSSTPPSSASPGAGRHWLRSTPRITPGPWRTPSTMAPRITRSHMRRASTTSLATAR
jgi:hypothetical protein